VHLTHESFTVYTLASNVSIGDIPYAYQLVREQLKNTIRMNTLCSFDLNIVFMWSHKNSTWSLNHSCIQRKHRPILVKPCCSIY